MKQLPALALTAVVLTAFTACDLHVSAFSGGWSDSDLKAVTNLTQTAEIPNSLKNLDVDNAQGDVRITGTENGPARWTWRLEVRARTDAIAREIATNVNCKVEMDGDRLRLVVKVPESNEPRSVRSNFEIGVPKAAAVKSQTHFGRSDISELAGEVEAADQNGGVEIHNVSGHVHARTSFASLNVSDTGPAKLKDQNGEIQATRIGGPLEAQTSFARLRAQDIHGPAALENQNGAIDAVDIGGLLHANTSFSPIEARHIVGAVFLRNQNGSVNVAQAKSADVKTSFSRLSVEDIDGDAVLKNQNGSIAGNGISGSVKAETSFASIDIQGSGSMFDCHNQNGSVRLRATSTVLANIDASTSFSGLELYLPAAAKPMITAHTSFGNVDSDFPVLTGSRGEDGFAEPTPDTLRVHLRNQNGSIRILRD